MNRNGAIIRGMEEDEELEEDVLYTIIPYIDEGIAEESGMYEDEEDEELDLDF